MRDLRLDALAGKRAAKLGRHRRVASHRDVGVNVAELNIAQSHPSLPPGRNLLALTRLLMLL